jgi:Type VIII secretion system (T8SS), CsgF protein
MNRFVLAGFLIITPASASEMVFKFNNPSFSGEGWSSHVLTIENQEYTRKMKIMEDQKAAAAKAAADAKNTNLAKFLNNLESRIYATISQKVAEKLFSNTGETNGNFDVAGSNIFWEQTTDGIHLIITDSGGMTTDITVPVGSLGI